VKSALGKYIGTPLRHITTSSIKSLISSGTVRVAVDNSTGNLFVTYNGTFTSLGFNETALGNVTFPDQLNSTEVIPLNGTLLGNGTVLNGTLQGAGSFGLGGNGTLLSNGTLSGVNGTLSSNGTLLSGTLLNNGTLLVGNGTLLNNGTLLSNLNSTGTLVNGTLLNNGTLLLNNGTLLNITLNLSVKNNLRRHIEKPHLHAPWPFRPGTVRRYMSGMRRDDAMN
jgi:hypothetical protein